LEQDFVGIEAERAQEARQLAPLVVVEVGEEAAPGEDLAG
jgi:hypothetical protein